MIAVVQRVLSASVTVKDPTYRSSIEQGLVDPAGCRDYG